MKRFLTFVALVISLVLPSHAIAGTPYSINWVMVDENPMCEHAHLARDGMAIFDVNGTPIPTYEVPGAFTVQPNGWESNLAQAGFDSVLLRMGANEFAFSVRNASADDSCVHGSEVVTLVSAQLGIEKLLFDVRRDGTAFSGSTQLDLKLEEINPQLAQDIVILEEELATERKFLVENANKIADLDERFDALQSLETELGDLLTRPLDEITAEDLDELLNRYSPYIDEATRIALQQVLADLKKSIVDLQTELASLMANFGEQADAVADFITGDARQNGFSPDDPSNYGLGPNDVPWVDVPDISDIPGAFDPANDPYAAYADAVIASLNEYVVGGVVTGRANFVAEVRAWRSNQAALQKAIQARMSVSQAETSAFLNAQNKVTGYLQKYMNDAGWFKDAPVPQDVRADVDGVLKNLYGPLAEDLKDRLNEWEASINPPEASLFFDTLRAFSAGMQAGEEIAQQYRDVMQTIVHGATRIGIGFVPFVGPALDLCEAVSGHEYCLPSGRMLTTGERVFSGIGFGVGKLVKVWKGVGSAAISGEGKVAAAGIVELGDDLAKLLRAQHVKSWRTLVWQSHWDIGELWMANSIYERKAMQSLMENEGHRVLAPGDKIVRKLVGIPESGSAGTTIACDFLTVTKDDKLVLGEVKGILGGEVDVDHAVKQLRNVVKALNGKKDAYGKTLAASIERVQIFVPKDSVSKFSADFTEEAGLLLFQNKPVTLKNQGWPALIVQVVYQ